MWKLWKDKRASTTLEYCLILGIVMATMAVGARNIANDISLSLHNTACQIVTGLTGHPSC